MRLQLAAAALLGLFLTLAGAIGAHSLPECSQSWDSAILFGFIHVLAIPASQAGYPASRSRQIAGWLFLIGVMLFSVTILVRAMTAARSGADPLAAIGPLAPVGGLSFMAGWVALCVSALRPRA